MRRALVASVLTSLFSLALLGGGAMSASAATLPAEGVFENCPLNTAMSTCIQRLSVMHAGGVNVVVFPVSYEAPSDLATYAAAAHNLGMSVMWETSNPGWWQEPATSTDMSGYFSFGSTCGCNENGPLLSGMIHFLGGLPGTYGYYAADDTMLSPGDGPGVARYVAQIKAADPSHTVMIGSAMQSQTNTYERSADLVGAEVYPVTNSSLMPASRHQDIWGEVAQTAIDTQTSANQTGKASAFILQGFTWGDNLSDGQAIGVCSSSDTQGSCYGKAHYPSAGEQLQLRNEVLAHSHPKLILWWSFPGTFGQVGNDTYSIYPTGGVAAARWAGLSNAIQAPWPTTSTKRKAVTARVANVRHKVHRKHKTVKRHRKHVSRRHHARRHHAKRTHRTRHSRRTHALAVVA